MCWVLQPKTIVWTAGLGGMKRRVDEEKDLGESCGGDEESDRSRKGWLEWFSTLKVGPPRYVKAVTRSTGMMR